MNILIVKLSSMGDIIHTLPALSDAKKYIPNIQFDWVIEENFSEIPSWHPTVYNIFPIALRRWKNDWFNKKYKKERKIFFKKLKLNTYDAIIDAQGLLKSAIITKFANGITHGMNWYSAKEPYSSFFYNKKHFVNKKQHAIERIRELFSKILNYKKPNLFGNSLILPYFLFYKNNLNKKKPYLVFLHCSSRKKKIGQKKIGENLFF